MKKLFLTVIALTAAGSLSACWMEDHHRSDRDLPEGTYKSDVSRTDASGTTYETETSTDVDVDNAGHKKIVKKKKTTKDPKGLFNKKTTSQTKEVIDEQQ